MIVSTPRSSALLTVAIAAAAALTFVAFPSPADVPDDEEISSNRPTATAILAGGCFWGMEDLFRKLPGVVDTEVGYAADKNRKRIADAEALRIAYDPSRVSFEDLLRFYFTMHDPTTKNRQGNDRGAEYRSAIFYLDDEQRATAERVIAEVDASGFWKKPLVTEVNEFGGFRVAKEFHQDYLVKNPGGYTCHYVRTR